tara:strand:+ start:1930 stop:2805 length:876 start_codon:yes stop_codon:yes gene_type:complete
MKHTKKAGVVPFHSKNETNYIKDKISLYYTDCLAQCFYILRYTNYKNSLLLQKISHHYGIDMFDVIRILNKAFSHTKYRWTKMGNLTYLIQNILYYNTLKDNEATLAFLESSDELLRPNHFVVIYRKGNHIMIRDPQQNARNTTVNSNYTLFDYLINGHYDYLYFLNDLSNEHTPVNGVKRQHICDIFHCELYEERDRIERKKRKIFTKKYKQYTNKILKFANNSYKSIQYNSMPIIIEPRLSDPPEENDIQPLYHNDYTENFNNVPKLIPDSNNSYVNYTPNDLNSARFF